MTDELDTSRAPRGTIAAEKLVTAAAAIGDLAERHYLELKGPRSLSSKTDKAKIAKFILGAANRMPERAAVAFEGCAVMIIGITPEGVVGVPPVEMHELTQVIEPFLGPAGPRWDIQRVPVERSSNEVLLVIVEPPQAGDPIFPCRANGEKLSDGRVYIRADGETREANSAELDLLTTRSSAVSAAHVDLEVKIVSDLAPVDLDVNGCLEDYIAYERSRLLRAMPRTKPESSTHPLSAYNLSSLGDATVLMRSLKSINEVPEDRTEEQYRAEIDAWEVEVRAVWTTAVDSFLGRLLPSLAIRLKNQSHRYLQDIQVKIHLEGNVTGITFLDRDDELPSKWSLGLPSGPRPWGPRPNPILDVGARPYYGPGLQPYIPPLASNLGWENSGSIDLTLRAGDLRPRATETFDEEELVLLLWTDASASPVHGTWEITARGYDHVFDGDLTIEIAEPVDLDSVLRSVLELPEK